MKLFFSVLLIVFSCFFAKAQCKSVISGDFQSKEFSSPCPVFNFSPSGLYTQDWVAAAVSLDIKMVETEIMPIKSDLEQQLREYAGEDFFAKMEFKSVDISKTDSIKKFNGRYPPVDMYVCKTKYFFYYYYYPRPEIKYCIGIALDDNKKIISPFNFPSGQDYLPEDPLLDFCRVMEIVKETGTSIQPIESVSFDFDTDKKQFMWWIKQKIVNPKEGENERNEISIEATDSKQVVSYMKVILLDANGIPVKRKEGDKKIIPRKKATSQRKT